MMHITRKLPERVKLSEHLKEKATFYICVTLFGISYYIAATPKIRQLLGLDSKGKPVPPDRRRRWTNYEKADALRDIVAALHLQVRDVVLAGIEEDVKRALLARMDEAMTPTVHGMIEERAAKLLPETSE